MLFIIALCILYWAALREEGTIAGYGFGGHTRNSGLGLGVQLTGDKLSSPPSPVHQRSSMGLIRTVSVSSVESEIAEFEVSLRKKDTQLYLFNFFFFCGYLAWWR